MLCDGYTHVEIARILGVGEKTVQRVVRLYQEHGIEGVSLLRYKGREASLNVKQLAKLKSELTQNLYKDTIEVQAYILQEFNLALSRSGITQVLKRLGFVYKKTKVMPGKANGKEQERFVRKLQELRDNLSPDEAIYFADGTHPTYNTRPGYAWIPKGTEYHMPSNTGRQRVNINGAMNGEDPTDVVVDFPESVNAQSTINVCEDLLARNPDKKTIYFVMDNALYYRSKCFKEWMEDHPKIQPIYLPAYSPNLNLIERLWGFMKRERLNNYYFDSYAKFRRSLHEFFNNLSEDKCELNRLITWNFQIVQWD
jgi:transposase